MQTTSAAEALLSRCSATSEPLLPFNLSLPGENEEALLGRVRTLKPVHWDRTTSFVPGLTEAMQPALLRGTVVDSWAAREWTWERLRQLHAGQTLVDVMQSDSHLYLVPDTKAALQPLLQHHVPHRMRNMSAAAFFDEMEIEQARHDATGYERTAAGRAAWRRGGRRLVHFAAVGSGALSRELEPRSLLFSNAEDEKKSMQYVWLSTPGVRTHTHFDSDHNIFVQLVGRKRFTLWAPNQTDALCMFPRLHPLWHKSRLDFERPDARLPCTAYSTSEALSVEVGPGDVLYLPPFWWHTVETLSPSASLSTLSRYHLLYNRMRGLYRMNYHFDKLAHYKARVYSLRAFLLILIRRMRPQPRSMEPAEVGFFRRLASRYQGFEHLFQHDADDATTLCGLGERGTPSCNNCLGNIKADAVIAWDEHFKHLPDGVREPLFDDYVEEMTAWVLGAGKALPFWQQCFLSESGSLRFFKTQPGSEEHIRLWQET